jgi:Phosphotransferase enzyme family
MLTKDSIDTLSRLALDSLKRAAWMQNSHFSIKSGETVCASWRSNGFSDSAIYRLATEDGVFAIRSWPNRFDTPSKVEFWSCTNKSLSGESNSLLLVGASNPTPFPRIVEWHSMDAPVGLLLPHANKLWTLCEWVAGEPAKANGVSKAMVQHLATILGRLHSHSSQGWQSSPTTVAKHTSRSNSLRERLELLKSIDYGLLASCDPTHFFANHHLIEMVKHCLAILMERQPSWLRFLTICESQNRECHWIVRDLWSENILVDERERFSSIVDLGAARIDWPGLDFVRLFGSLLYRDGNRTVYLGGGSGEDLWNDAYVSYTQSHTGHAIESLDECKMLHQVSLGLSIVQWVLWIKAGSIDLNQSDKVQRVSNRIHALCDQMLVEVE